METLSEFSSHRLMFLYFTLSPFAARLVISASYRQDVVTCTVGDVVLG